MTRLISFVLDRPGLDTFGFVLQRDSLPSNGDLESSFLDGIAQLQRHPANAPIGLVLKRVSQSMQTVVVIRNPDLVLDHGLQDAIITATESLESAGAWALAGAGGLGLNERRHIGLYASQAPAIPEHCGLQPLIDLMPDLYLVNSDFLKGVPDAVLSRLQDALEPALVVQGYLEGRVSAFTPALVAGINGDLSARDFTRVVAELQHAFSGALAGQTIATLSGPVILDGGPETEKPTELPVDLDQRIQDAIAQRAAPASLSIITRTRLDRPHLLRRMLTSISRARRPDMQLEVVLSTDTRPCEAELAFEELKAEFVNLKLRLKLNPPGGHSRVTNLMGGIQVAVGEYLMFLDDDDYLDIFAFDAMRGATFAGNRPVIALTCTVQEETWQETTSGRWILSQSAPMKTYPASGWRNMFEGVNRMPICGMLFSRTRLRTRLKSVPLRYDLSEDYALFLLMLTDPQLSEVYECVQPSVHISIRDNENSVMMTDRRPWVRDIARFLADLTRPDTATGAGQWILHSSKVPDVHRSDCGAIADLQQQLTRRDQEIRLLRRQLRSMQAHSETVRESAA